MLTSPDRASSDQLAGKFCVGREMSARLTMKFIHRRFPWLPPLVVLTLAVAGLVLLEMRSRTPTEVAASQPAFTVGIDNDMTAALLLLSRTQDVTPEVFTCPTTQPSKWDFGGGTNTALNWSNWITTQGPDRKLSYSYQNPYDASSSGTRTDPGRTKR